MNFAIRTAALMLLGSTATFAVDLSPGRWPAAERARIEKLESQGFAPSEEQTFASHGGMVSATVSPIAVYAGVRALQQGGSAADAAATTALTQITSQLGSVVSYAGIFTLVYFDAKTHKVYSLDGGYNSYLQETDPATIPVGDLGPLSSMGPKATEGGAKGRETLVPGFMSGLEAMHRRFGRLPFKTLFAPAIWYDEHGVLVSAHLEAFFKLRAKFLARTPEGEAFLHQAGGAMPKQGELFLQPELAKTLQAISAHGASYMYGGKWGQDFIRIVQREGGKVTTEDLARYRPIWSEPYKETVFGHTVYVNGPPHYGAYDLLTGLNLAAALKLDARGPYWSDPDTFQGLARISEIVSGAPVINKKVAAFLKDKGIDVSPQSQLTKSYAASVAQLLDQIFTVPADSSPHHSNAIVVVDKEGNIAAVTHTINAVIWGDTGIVVDGIPIPDSAAFQQERLATIKPGDRVPHEIIDVIAFAGDKPVLATGSIGASLVPESLRVLLGVLGQHQSLKTVMAAPPLLAQIDFGTVDIAPGSRPAALVAGAYADDFVAKLKAKNVNVTPMPVQSAAGLRGTLAAIAIDPDTGERSAVNQPGVMVFNGAD